MPGGFAYDGETAYYDSLARKVRADEAAKEAATDSAERERRVSLGLPAEEKRRKSLNDWIPFGSGTKNGRSVKKSAGEIASAMAFGNQSSMGAPRDAPWKTERDALDSAAEGKTEESKQ